jgi:hypothetical protein
VAHITYPLFSILFSDISGQIAAVSKRLETKHRIRCKSKSKFQQGYSQYCRTSSVTNIRVSSGGTWSTDRRYRFQQTNSFQDPSMVFPHFRFFMNIFFRQFTSYISNYVIAVSVVAFEHASGVGLSTLTTPTTPSHSILCFDSFPLRPHSYPSFSHVCVMSIPPATVSNCRKLTVTV